MLSTEDVEMFNRIAFIHLSYLLTVSIPNNLTTYMYFSGDAVFIRLLSEYRLFSRPYDFFFLFKKWSFECVSEYCLYSKLVSFNLSLQFWS